VPAPLHEQHHLVLGDEIRDLTLDGITQGHGEPLPQS
jgi:hypothetical protein